MTLGLNCGFGMGEIATLRRDEVFLYQVHPLAGHLNLSSTTGDSWIRRIRTKTGVYGEWKLWRVTVAALEWLMTHRPESDLPYMVLTKNGTGYKVEGQRNNQISNAWGRLTKRVYNDDKGFERLSFNKLRKTAANKVRIDNGDELASLFLSHGQAISDDLLRNYTNPRFAALHVAIDHLGEQLTSVFASVDDPFPQKEKRGGANISIDKIRRIESLHRSGKSPILIAEMLNISAETARRWIKRASQSPTGSVPPQEEQDQ